MGYRKFVIGRECRNLLQEAVDKQMFLTLTNKRDQNWQIYKSNFLAMQSHRIILAEPTDVAPHGQMEPSPGQELAITFKKGYHKCLFVTRLIEQGRFEIEPDLFVPTLVVYRPEQIEKIQRRAYNRTAAPASEPVNVAFWSDDASHPAAQEEYQGVLTNISAGGIGLSVPGAQAPLWQEGQQCRLQFVPMPGEEPLCLEASFRHATEADQNDNAIMGFQFVGLEMTEQGRSTLRRLGSIVRIYQQQHKQFKQPAVVRR